ncbi:Integrase (fragment) [Methylacidimicrobium sp. AP8]
MERDLCEMTLATIDRLLAPIRCVIPKRLCGTKPGSLLKISGANRPLGCPRARLSGSGHRGPLRAELGWGLPLDGQLHRYLIYSGWTASRAVRNKGATEIVEKTRRIEGELPFPIPGFDCDNGREFLNHHLLRSFSQRRRPAGFTPSRPYPPFLTSTSFRAREVPVESLASSSARAELFVRRDRARFSFDLP